MSKTREEFEKLPEIAEIFKGLHPTIIWFCDKSNKYATSFSGFDDRVMWLNGAWYAFQEQQKKIDEIVSIVRDADLSDGDSSVAIVHDEIQELLK